MRHGFLEIADGLKVGQHGLTTIVPIHAAIGRWCVLIQLCVERENRDHFQTVALGAGVVVKVMRTGNFDAAATKLRVHEAVRDDRDLAIT